MISTPVATSHSDAARTVRLPVLDEIHTSDLTARCFQQVKLKHEGKERRTLSAALYKGLLFHAVAQAVHEQDRWDAERVPGLVNACKQTTMENAALEGRTIGGSLDTDAKIAKATGEVLQWSDQYVRRFRDYFAASKLIGCEIPIRCRIALDPPAQFASHLDLMFRDPHGSVCVWDWKTGKDAPTFAFLKRNQQLAAYYMAVMEGTFKVHGTWMRFDDLDVTSSQIAWIHIRCLIPYKQRSKDPMYDEDTGEKRYFYKGDLQPFNRIVRDIPHSNRCLARTGKMIADRLCMFRNGHFPPQPEPNRCMACDCAPWCEAYTEDNNG